MCLYWLLYRHLRATSALKDGKNSLEKSRCKISFKPTYNHLAKWKGGAEQTAFLLQGYMYMNMLSKENLGMT